MKKILLVLLLFSFSYAGLLVHPEKVMKENFPEATEIKKKNFLILKSQAKEIEKLSNIKLKSKIVPVYIARKDNQVLGYSILHIHRVRTKNEAVLISLTSDCKVLDVEVIAFYEPPEYIAPENWLKLFEGKGKQDNLKLRQGIPNITGATLTAQAVADAVRQSVAICEVVLKK